MSSQTERGPFAPKDFNRKLEDARKELLAATTRSRLLHTPIGSKRAKIIEVIGESSRQVFDLLVVSGKPMSFQPDESTQTEDSSDQLLLPEDEPTREDVWIPADTDQTDNKLQTALSMEALQTKLRSIAYDAQSYEDEQGVNLLYLALGFLKWSEVHDPQAYRYAPLVLVPVQISRSSVRERFKLKYSGEEISTNLPLYQRLKEEEVELPQLPDAEELNPEAYASQVESAIGGKANWEILPDCIVLGFFSFAKLLMYRDLDPKSWPENSPLSEHRILCQLLKAGLPTPDTEQLLDDVPVDPIVDIASAGHVVDADSSQMLAIHEVVAGKNMVIEGPPGTGKSQTITNLIAGAVKNGKKVLFVAEKLAALKVVKSNLDRIGLGNLCLELHSQKAKKKAVLEDQSRRFLKRERTYPPIRRLLTGLDPHEMS